MNGWKYLSLSRMMEHEKTEHALFLNVWQERHMFGNYEAVMKAHQLCFFLPLVIWLTSAFWTQLLRSNSLLVLQHADRKFLSLTRCEPNKTSYWHLRDVIWGEYVARCGNTVSLVSSSFCCNIIGQWSMGTHRTHRFNSYRIREPINHKIMHIWCFPLYAIMKYFKLIQQCFDLLIRVL